MINPFAIGRPGGLGSMHVITDPNMVEQFRFPRSKRKRIQAKWKKSPLNFRPARYANVDNLRGIIYCHPAVAAEMRRQIPHAV